MKIAKQAAEVRTRSAWAGFVVAIAIAAAGAPCVASAQYRIADALSLADIASGSLTGLGAACASKSAEPSGRVQPTIPGLPPIPGSGPSPSERQVYFAAGGGFAVFETDAAGLGGRGAAVAEARAHWVPPSTCRFDGFAGVNGSTTGALSATLEGRYIVLGGNAYAPAVELTAAHSTGGAYDSENPGSRLAGRFSVTTPNLYAWTIGRIGDALLGERSPKLDLRARLFAGWTSFTGDYWRPLPPLAYELSDDLRLPWHGGGAFTEAGGTAHFGLLHLPVSLLVTSEHVIGGYLPVGHPRSRDAIGFAYRLPGFDKNAWVVGRAERFRDLKTTTSYRLEFAHLLLGVR